jgi:glutamate/aspartate transport system permease protein
VPATIYVNGMRSIPLVMVILWFFLLMPPSSAAHRRRAVGHHHLHRLRGGLLQRDHARRHPVHSAWPGVCRPGAGHDLWPEHALVVLPQAFRNMLPVLLTQTIILFQDTSLVYAIGAYDMLKGFEVAGKNFGRPIEAYLAAAVSTSSSASPVLAGQAPAQEDRHHPLSGHPT